MVSQSKWLTDITEFAIFAGKVYLSPIVDCFDGYLMSWTIVVSPDASLVNGMLDEAAIQLYILTEAAITAGQDGYKRWKNMVLKGQCPRKDVRLTMRHVKDCLAD